MTIGTIANPAKQYVLPPHLMLNCASPNLYITQKGSKLLQLEETNPQLIDVGGFNNINSQKTYQPPQSIFEFVFLMSQRSISKRKQHQQFQNKFARPI